MPNHCSPTKFRALIAHLTVILMVSLLCFLGLWQYQRWQSKIHFLEEWTAQAQAKPIDAAALLESSEINQLNFRMATIEGEHLPELLYLDNQIHNGQAGYDVLGILKLPKNQAILINHGWTPQAGNRKKLPDIGNLIQQQPITGQLRIPSKPLFTQKAFESSNVEWPAIVQFIDFTTIAQQLNLSLLPIILDSTTPGSKLLQKRNAVTQWLTPERHLGYSFQWFSLAICLLVIYLILLYKHRKNTYEC